MQARHAKTILVTGASRSLGLGFATAREFARQHYHVILTGRNFEWTQELAAALRRDGLTASALALDLAETSVQVNPVDPGPVVSNPERGDDRGDRSSADAARWIIQAAMLGPEGRSGDFFRHGAPLSGVGM